MLVSRNECGCYKIYIEKDTVFKMVRIIIFFISFVVLYGCSSIRPISDVSYTDEIKRVLNGKQTNTVVNDVQGRLRKEIKGRSSSVILKDVALDDFLRVVFSEVLKAPYVLDRSVEKLNKRIDVELPASYRNESLYSVVVALMDKMNIDIEEIEGVTVFSVRNSGTNSANNSGTEIKGASNLNNSMENKVKSDCVYTYKPRYSKSSDLQKSLKDLITSDQGRVVVHESTNSLIFKSSQSERRSIIKLLRLLDEKQKQIAVDVTIAEVLLTEDLSLGLEGFLKNNNVSIGLSTGNSLGYGMAATLNFPDILNAVLQVGEKRGVIKIRSNPYLLIENGSKSSIAIGSEFPVLSSQKSTLDTTTTTQSVEYRKTGVILSLTPVVTGSDIHVNSSIELSEGQKNELSTLDSPAILTRKIESSVVVQSGQNIIIGGLISETKNKAEKLAPAVWGKSLKIGEIKAVNRTELVVIMQVSVVDDRNSINWFEQLAEKYKEQKIVVNKKGER
jgi:hypothetical protein